MTTPRCLTYGGGSAAFTVKNPFFSGNDAILAESTSAYLVRFATPYAEAVNILTVSTEIGYLDYTNVRLMYENRNRPKIPRKISNKPKPCRRGCVGGAYVKNAGICTPVSLGKNRTMQRLVITLVITRPKLPNPQEPETQSRPTRRPKKGGKQPQFYCGT